MYTQLLQQIDVFGERFKDLCEKRKFLFLLVFSVVYLASTCLLAWHRLLWNDELFTLYFSRLPTLSDIWAALLTGADQIPPFFHLLTRLSFAIFGINQLSLRLPEILGFWLMCICLFYFVSRRFSALYGFAAMLFPLATFAYEYSYEARPYGLVLGFSSLALLCWQLAASGLYRKLTIAGLTLSIAAALSCHYYGILLLFPLAVGELVRSFSRRRLDIWMWIGLAIGMSVLVLYLPLIERSRTYSGHFWAPPRWILLPGFYYFLLAPAVLPLVVALIAAAIPSSGATLKHPPSDRESEPLIPVHEMAAAFGFTAIPLVALIVGKTVTEAFTYRYALPTVIGFSILFAVAIYRMATTRETIGTAFVLSLCIGFGFLVLRNFSAFKSGEEYQLKTYELIRSEGEKNLPIVAGDLHTFMLLVYYAPADISNRMVYLADPDLSFRYLGYTAIDQGILDLRPWFRVNVKKYKPYFEAQHRFLLFTRVKGDRFWLGSYWGEPWALNWLISELDQSHARLELIGRNDDELLFLVSH